MDACEICGGVSVGQSSNDKSIDFSFIELGNPITNEDLAIASQNHAYIEPVSRQLLEYEMAIKEATNNRSTGRYSWESKDALLKAKKKLEIQKEIISNRDRVLQDLLRQKETIQSTISAQQKMQDTLHSLSALSRDVKEAKEKLFNTLRDKRLRTCLKLFSMFDIKAFAGDSESSQSCSTIMGLPFPNNGYYEECSIDLLCTALSHLAHFVDSLSASVNIPLPHPLAPFESNGPTISPQYSANLPHSLLPVVIQTMREEYRFFSWKSLRDIRNETNPSTHIQLNSYFPQALSLFQANVISLCLKMGFQPQELLPPYCILPNLIRLKQRIEDAIVDKNSPTVAAPMFHHNIMLDYQMLETHLQSTGEEMFTAWCARYRKFRAKPFDQEANISNAKDPHENLDDEWDLVEVD